MESLVLDEIGEGWQPLIAALEAAIDWDNKMLHENTILKSCSIHNKELRFKLENSTPRTDAFSFVLSEASSRICEVCGKPALQNISWKATCEEHL